MKNVSKISFVIIGTIIGAGFISGQEIYLFFNKFGTYGLIGIIIAGILIGMTIEKTCILIKEKNINNYKEFIENSIPIKNKYIKLVLNNSINLFLLISFFIMEAAFNAYFMQEFQIPIWITGIFNAIICYLVFIKNIKAIIKINEILMPIILLLILFLSLKIENNILLQPIEYNDINNLILAIFNGIIYASYNSILLIPILITLNKYLTGKKQIKIIKYICVFIIISFAILMYILINPFCKIEQIEIPIMYIANSLGSVYHYIYGVVLIIAIFTAVISVGYGFLKNVTQKERDYRKLAMGIGIASIPISYIGFANLVELLYPIIGIFGIIQIIFILKYWKKSILLI